MRVLRGFVAGALVVVGLVLVPLGDLGVWTRRVLLSTDGFVRLSVQALRFDDVRDSLAKQVADQLVKREPRLAGAKASLTNATRSVIASEAFGPIFRTAAAGMEAQLRHGDHELTLDLDPMVPFLRETLARTDAPTAAVVPSSGLATIPVVSKHDAAGLESGVRTARQVWWLLPLGSVVLLVGAVAVAGKRARTLIVVGAAVVVGSVGLVVAVRVGRDSLRHSVQSQASKAAFVSAWDQVTGSLVTQTVVIGVLGVVLCVSVAVSLALRSRRFGRRQPATAPPTTASIDVETPIDGRTATGIGTVDGPVVSIEREDV